MDAEVGQGTEAFVIALVFGLVSVWYHAMNQFDRSTYAQSTEFFRLLEKLRPSDLRKGDVYRQAFVFYAAILTLIYLAVCALLSVPGLQQFAELVPGLSSLGDAVGAGKLPEPGPVAGVAFDESGGFEDLGGLDPLARLSPSIPLAVSLAVVGLSPNVPVLRRFEEFVRETAHRLSGIPTHLVAGAKALRRATLLPAIGEDGQPSAGEGLQPSDRARLDQYAEAIKNQKLDNAERFNADITQIIVLRRWVLEQELFAPYLPISTKYRLAEADVRERVGSLVRDLDRASGYGGGGDANGAAANGTQHAKPNWPSLVADAEDTVEALCLLVVLYEEHHALQMATQTAGESGEDKRRTTAARGFLKSMTTVMQRANVDNVASELFSRLTIAILSVAAIGSLVAGGILILPLLEAGSRSTGLAKHVLLVTGSAAVTYVPALFFTLTYQQSRYVSVPPTWENSFAENSKRSKYLPQLLTVFTMALLLAFFFRLGYHFSFLISQVGIEILRDRIWEILDYAVWLEFMFAFQGAAVAVVIVLIIDAWRAGSLKPLRWWIYFLVPGMLSAIAAVGWYLRRSEPGAAGLIDWRSAAVQEIAPAAFTGLVVALYCVVYLREEFPEVYASGIPKDQV